MSYSISYSSMADIYALAEDETGEEKKSLLSLAEDLEQMGTGSYAGEEYVLYESNYGTEVLSMEDYLTETGEEEDE